MLHLMMSVMCFFLVAAADAPPPVLLNSTIVVQHAGQKKYVLSIPPMIVESGKQASITVGNLTFSATPSLGDRGVVTVKAVLAEDGQIEVTFQMVMKIGSTAQVSAADYAIEVKATTPPAGKTNK